MGERVSGRKGENIYFYNKNALMIIEKHVSLKRYNTFGLNYQAECIIHLKSEKEAKSVFDGTF